MLINFGRIYHLKNRRYLSNLFIGLRGYSW